MSYFPFLYDYGAYGMQNENLDSRQKRLFDRSTRPEKRDVYLPDPITVGTPLEPLSHFIDAADTLGIFNLFKPKAQYGGGDEFMLDVKTGLPVGGSDEYELTREEKIQAQIEADRQQKQREIEEAERKRNTAIANNRSEFNQGYEDFISSLGDDALDSYKIKVIQYPLLYGMGTDNINMPPGHIEASLIDADGNYVYEIGPGYKTFINRWTNSGNRPVTFDEDDIESGVRTAIMDLSPEDFYRFITAANAFAPGSNENQFEFYPGMSADAGYDFANANCADGLCLGLYTDPNYNDPYLDMESNILTDPRNVMEQIRIDPRTISFRNYQDGGDTDRESAAQIPVALAPLNLEQFLRSPLDFKRTSSNIRDDYNPEFYEFIDEMETYKDKPDIDPYYQTMEEVVKTTPGDPGREWASQFYYTRPTEDGGAGMTSEEADYYYDNYIDAIIANPELYGYTTTKPAWFRRDLTKNSDIADNPDTVFYYNIDYDPATEFEGIAYLPKIEPTPATTQTTFDVTSTSVRPKKVPPFEIPPLTEEDLRRRDEQALFDIVPYDAARYAVVRGQSGPIGTEEQYKEEYKNLGFTEKMALKNPNIQEYIDMREREDMQNRAKATEESPISIQNLDETFEYISPDIMGNSVIEFYDDNRNVIESVPINEFFENYNAYKDMISRQQGGSTRPPITKGYINEDGVYIAPDPEYFDQMNFFEILREAALASAATARESYSGIKDAVMSPFDTRSDEEIRSDNEAYQETLNEYLKPPFTPIKQGGGPVFEPQVELNIDPNAFPSTNPVITVTPTRMSDREFVDAFYDADTREDAYALIEADSLGTYDLFGNYVPAVSTKEMDIRGGGLGPFGIFDNPALLEMYNPINYLLNYYPEGDKYDADIQDDLEFIERVTGYKRQQMGGSAGGRMTQAEALLAYNEALEEMKIAREAFGSNDTEMLRELGTLSRPYGPNDLRADYIRLQELREAAGLGLLEDFKITLPHFGQMIRGGYNHMFGTHFQAGGPVYDERGVIEFEPDRDKARNQRTVGDPDDTKIFPDPNEDDVVEETEEDGLSPFGKFSNAAVSVARGMNQIALRKQQREAERLKRMNLSADNLFAVSDPLYERGTFDVNTGIAQSDNLVPYLPMGEMGMEVEADEEMIRKLIAAGAQIKF